jgi:queuine/archaeosine tRNA-ribosyltransferase
MLRFITALTLCPSDIRKISRLLDEHNVAINTLKHILVTPLFVHNRSLQRIEELKQKRGSTVLFDSGGYYVQIGKLTYEELYYPLLKFYRNNPWADIYTLPDHVPTSQDTKDIVWRKVRETARYSKLFYQELPLDLQERAMPVVQGHTLDQVDHCLKTYLSLGIRHIGFGSFGTVGKNSEVNVATSNAVHIARYVAGIAKKNDINVHFFGLGAPALVAMIYATGANSFDSSSWIKAAGFGQVYLPFTRGYNISHRNGHSELQKGITVKEFRELRLLTGHQCPFCSSIEKLQKHKLYRALHNLLVIQETVELINSGNHQTIKAIYEQGSPRYRQEYEKWLASP